MAEDDLTLEQRRALADARAARGPCPDAELLVAYGELPESERARDPIHAHVQLCSRCQLVVLTLEEPPAERSRSYARWALPLAAVLVLAIVAPVIYRSVTGPPEIDTIRGSELQPIVPIGTVAVVDAFTWQTPIRAARYRVRLFRGAEIVWTGESTETRVALPASVPLEPGVDYQWQVEALDAEGAVRMSSPRTQFALAP
jgi:hypothetical protein